MYKDGFVKVALISPKLAVGNPSFNCGEMLKTLVNNQAAITVFPELGITGYTCSDLFFHKELLNDATQALGAFLASNTYPGIIVCGMPFEIEQVVLNVAIVISGSNILGMVPKFYLPNTKEYYEKRWFNSGFDIVDSRNSILLNGQTVPFGNLIFDTGEFKFGIEICEDMWATITPGNLLSVNGAVLIINISASNETLGKADIRRNAVLEHSRKNAGAYVYVSAGSSESTSETVFSGHNIVASGGSLLAETDNFNLESDILYADIDILHIMHDRRNTSSFRDSVLKYRYLYQTISAPMIESVDFHFEKPLDVLPFVPKKNPIADFQKIASIQEYGLAKRIKHLGIDHLLVGISGGLDSSLALLIACRAFDRLKLSRKGIIAVTMPGMATGSRTKNNAHQLMSTLGVTPMEIPISNHVKEHLSMIGHDGTTEDLTYENAQARERTMILMNLANQHNGIVVGTGDLSEIALGWSTYNGDQMSMYNVNGGIPKTVVKFMIEKYAALVFVGEVSRCLFDIMATPISAELKSNQSTESIIGKYEINDFILYRFLVCGDTQERIGKLVKIAFSLTAEELDHYVENFFKRFYSQQFKRQASPDSPKVFEYALSPRGDWRMPSDVKR